MTRKTRYFAVASLLVLVVGLGVGFVAYYSGFSVGAFTLQGGPEELQFVPADASLVAYADVHEIMTSELRQRIRTLLPLKEDGQRQFEEQTGITIDSDIDRVVVAISPARTTSTDTHHGSALVLARGRFDEVKIEALMREHGATVEQYRDQRLIVAPEALDGQRQHHVSLAFLEPGLVAVGTPDLIRGAVDLKGGGASVLTNDEIMNLVTDLESGNAWAVGRFDVLASQANLPAGVTQGLPAIQWFSATAHIDSGIRGVLRAEARDDASATALRDVVRGVLALARLQASAQPTFEALMQSLDLGGTGKTVSLAFDIPASAFDALASLTHIAPAH